MNKGFLPWIAAAVLLVSHSRCRPVIPVDLLVYHARVYTANQDSTVAEAFAVHQGKFVEVGSTAFIQTKYKGVLDIDAAGNWVYPGYTDAQGVRQGKGTIVRQQEANFVILEEATKPAADKNLRPLRVARSFRQGREVIK